MLGFLEEENAHRPGAIHCRTLGKDLEYVNVDLFLDVQRWLRTHGKTARPKLTDEQKAQLQTCFELMDADGSGAIDADELQDAFELLGLNFTRAEIQELLDEVDRDGSGECEYPEFVEIMTLSLTRIREQQEKDGEQQGPDVSFELMATAYRRKRLMEGLMSGNREVQNQILNMAGEQMAHEAERKAEQAKNDAARRITAKEKAADLAARYQNAFECRLGASERAVLRKLVGKADGAAESRSNAEKLAELGASAHPMAEQRARIWRLGCQGAAAVSSEVDRSNGAADGSSSRDEPSGNCIHMPHRDYPTPVDLHRVALHMKQTVERAEAEARREAAYKRAMAHPIHPTNDTPRVHSDIKQPSSLLPPGLRPPTLPLRTHLGNMHVPAAKHLRSQPGNLSQRQHRSHPHMMSPCLSSFPILAEIARCPDAALNSREAKRLIAVVPSSLAPTERLGLRSFDSIDRSCMYCVGRTSSSPSAAMLRCEADASTQADQWGQQQKAWADMPPAQRRKLTALAHAQTKAGVPQAAVDLVMPAFPQHRTPSKLLKQLHQGALKTSSQFQGQTQRAVMSQS